MSENSFDLEQQALSPIDTKRHSLAHVLGAAVLELFPEAKLGIGPVIENGFYYDFELPRTLTPEDLPAIEEKMRSIIGRHDAYVRREASRDEAVAALEKAGQSYKVELVKELPADATITFYDSGSFSDLCRGPHVANAKELQATGWSLQRIAGAYWRGSEKNAMLQRVYGIAFDTKDELKAWQAMQEEAAKRDHRKLGKELKLFTISDLVGPGLPLLQPNGAFIKRALEDYLWELHADLGYSRVWTPHLAKEALYEMSGHAGHYMDDMFNVYGGSSKEKFYVKPMNCPHHMQIFADNQFSYREMPVRYFEPATVYRDEKTGQLGGLTRVRSITQDDGHLFCRVSQIPQEFSSIVGIVKSFYATMGMLDGYRVRLSLRGEDKANYLGSDKVWALAESSLKDVCEREQLPYFEGPGEAAFYGPKLDFMFKDAIGREHQLATIQCDFNLPERFDLSYVNEKGEKERPVVIHRAISGSLERFMGVMIEHFGGSFPGWLSPVQALFAPVSDQFVGAAEAFAKEWRAAGIRAEVDASSESVGKKVREASKRKIPYVIVIGEKESTGQDWQIRVRGQEEQVSLPAADALAAVRKAAATRSLSLDLK